MKKLLLAVILPFIFSCKATKDLKVAPIVSVDDGYEIEVMFQPDSEYVTNISQVTTTSMTMPNMPEQSSIIEVSTGTTLIFGEKKNNVSEMLIIYDEVDMEVTGVGAGQVQKPALAGMEIYGKLENGVQSIDSLVGGDEALRGIVETSLEPMFNNLQVDFPNPMKIGEEFLDTKVTKVPIEGAGEVSMTIETIYTLNKVVDGVADLTAKFKVNGLMSIMDKEFPVKGSGNGNMSIDLMQKYVKNSYTVMDQVMTMEMQGMSMEQKVNVSMLMDQEKTK